MRVRCEVLGNDIDGAVACTTELSCPFHEYATEAVWD